MSGMKGDEIPEPIGRGGPPTTTTKRWLQGPEDGHISRGLMSQQFRFVV